ncbi:XI-F [Symbiodinium natans]|uniref:XI-F protein n=1 Tax=Symbiodinium natans TaxID=878477 RepID=A0A812V6D5_9DINO|nr:XI-F [Symbiodinium natans]
MKDKHILQNQHVAVRNRPKYVDAVITPTVLFSWHTLPLTQKQLHDLNIVQRRMLRSIVGWRRVDGEAWSDTMMRVRPATSAGVVPARPPSPDIDWRHMLR